MKKYLIPLVSVFILGCTQTPMANSVVDMAGNQQVAGWDEGKTQITKPKEKIVVKKVIKYETEKDSDGDWVPDSVDKCPNTPPNLVVNHEGCPIITTLRINFDFNRAYVKKIYYPQIKKVAEVLKNNPHMKIEIAGYTDNIGSYEYNLKLSKKRAQAVKDLLVKFGISPKRMIVKGFGSKYPLVPNDNPTDRTLNRRVEIVDITDSK